MDSRKAHRKGRTYFARQTRSTRRGEYSADTSDSLDTFQGLKSRSQSGIAAGFGRSKSDDDVRCDGEVVIGAACAWLPQCY